MELHRALETLRSRVTFGMNAELAEID